LAVATMQKVRILFHHSVKEAVLEAVQRTGLVHINSMEASYPELPEGLSVQDQSDVGELEAQVSGAEFALDYLKVYQEKKGLLQKLASTRVELGEDEYHQVVSEFDEGEIVQNCRKLDRERVKIHGEIAEKRALKEQMGAWDNLDIPVEELETTRTSQVLTGSLPPGKFMALSQRLQEEVEAHHLELIGNSGLEENFLLIYHLAEQKAVTQTLEEMEFTEKKFTNLTGTPRQVSRQLDEEMDGLEKFLGELSGKSRQLVEHRPKLMVMAEHLTDKVEKKRAELLMANTEQVCLAEGWVKSKNLTRLREQLEGQFDPISVIVIDPLPDEMPPVELENKSIPGSFEMVIDLYGRPKYTELDPTPVLAPFFAIFFGLCLTDAGYGLTLVALSLFFLKKYRLGGGTKKLFQLILWSGLATIAAGVLTGGYFGIDWSKIDPQSPLVRAVYAVKLFDPIADAMTFFKVAIICGVAHIFAGLVMKMIIGIRAGQTVRSPLMHGPWLLADVGLGITMLNFLSPVGEGLAQWGGYLLGAGMVGIFLFSGIGSKNPIAWLGKGLGGLYGVISIFSDILSYSRLVALGLATAVIAGVIDILGLMLAKIPYVGILLAIVLFLIAHLAYMLISCLGAFVHTARLNFVEFFSKFYEGGGEPFTPLRKRGQYVVWNEGQKNG